MDRLAQETASATIIKPSTFFGGLVTIVPIALPLVTAVAVLPAATIPVVAGTSLLFLAALGAVAARAGGAPIRAAAVRVTLWGALAMALTAGVGALFGTSV